MRGSCRRRIGSRHRRRERVAGSPFGAQEVGRSTPDHGAVDQELRTNGPIVSHCEARVEVPIGRYEVAPPDLRSGEGELEARLRGRRRKRDRDYWSSELRRAKAGEFVTTDRPRASGSNSSA